MRDYTFEQVYSKKPGMHDGGQSAYGQQAHAPLVHATIYDRINCTLTVFTCAVSPGKSTGKRKQSEVLARPAYRLPSFMAK